MTNNIINYDPHLLYQAINITVELEYHIPFKLIYNILANLQEKMNPGEKEPSINEMVKLVKTMATFVDSNGVESEDMPDNLKSKIKLILSMLGCDLGNDELNKILRGDIAVEDILNKESQLAWKLIFKKDENERYHPSQECVNWLLLLAEDYTFGVMLDKYTRNCYEQKDYDRKLSRDGLHNIDNYKTARYHENRVPEYVIENLSLEKKMRNLKIYLGRMQGYDIDRDGDGQRGMDPETGEIIDFDDIFITDKIFGGAVIEDLNHNGLDLEDIKT